MTALSVQRTIAGVLTSADEARLTVTNSAGAIVVNDVIVAPTSEGIYTYETTALTPGLYTATWTFEVSGQPDQVISRVFEADDVVSLVSGCTLAQIEQLAARYIGPYSRLPAGDTSTVENVYIPRLKSRVQLDRVANQYILRRGVDWDNALITDFDQGDRVRFVENYVATTGIVTPDQDWANAPVENEAIEFMYLDPDQELRQCAQDGLRRCYFWDQLTVTLTDLNREINLTALFPWLTDPSLVAHVGASVTGSRIPTKTMHWWQPFYRNGAVYLNSSWVGAGDIRLDVLRPHSTYVNGEYSVSGPNSDSDILAVDVEYAALSAWVQAWVQYTDRLTAVAAQGNRLTSEMVASAFTTKSKNISEAMPEYMRIRWESTEVLTQVGNAPEED